MLRRRKNKKGHRNAAVKERFDKLHKQKKYRTDYIITTIADEFYLDNKTVEQIVYQMGNYKRPIEPTSGEQLTLFNLLSS